MKNLLDLVQDYQTGGYVNPFDQSGQPTQEGVMSQYDIELTDDKYQPFLPTYDQTGEQFAIDNYILGREGLYSGAQDALSTAGFQEQQRQATTGFAGSGTNLLDTTRSDIVSQFGREGQRMFSGLQQDIYGQRRGFEDRLLGALSELPDDAFVDNETGAGASIDSNLGNSFSFGDDGKPSDSGEVGEILRNPYNNKSYIYTPVGWVEAPGIPNNTGNDGNVVYTTDESGNTVENFFPDEGDPQTPDGTDVNINFTETSSGSFDPYSNIGQYVFIPDTGDRFQWDSSLGQYVQYTGG